MLDQESATIAGAQCCRAVLTKTTLAQVDMRDKMVNIDANLDQVKRNLEYLEEMYDTVFRKVNRLFVDVEI